MKGRRESEVQAGVLAYLSSRGDVFFWRNNTSAGIARSGQFMRSGMRGAPDILGCMSPTGRIVGIECKREFGGKLSSDQELFRINLENHGGMYVIATCVKDVEVALGPKLVRIPNFTRKRVFHKGVP